MKYSEYHAKPKKRGNTAFFIVLACCLLAIGGASWFAAANISGRKVKKGKTDSSSSFSDNSSSFTSSVTQPPVSSAENVGKSVSDEPYESSSKEDASSKETEDKPTAVSYTMPLEGDILKNYSEKELRYSATYGDMRMHTGIDIACESGTMISACGAGTVTEVTESAAYGVTVTIDHGNGLTSKYSAVKDVKVKVGQKIAMGDIIGSAETVPCECADQSHLHFEVLKNGHAADPLKTLGLK